MAAPGVARRGVVPDLRRFPAPRARGAGDEPARYDYDPEDPVPTVGGSILLAGHPPPRAAGPARDRGATRRARLHGPGSGETLHGRSVPSTPRCLRPLRPLTRTSWRGSSTSIPTGGRSASPTASCARAPGRATPHPVWSGPVAPSPIEPGEVYEYVDRPVGDGHHVPPGAQDSGGGHLELPSSLGAQPQHGRGGLRFFAHRGGPPDHLSGRRASEQDHADRSRRVESMSVSKAVLITGCSSGIGWATAERLANVGWRVYATARNVEDIAPLEESGCRLLSLDVTDEDSMVSAVEEVERRGRGRRRARQQRRLQPVGGRRGRAHGEGPRGSSRPTSSGWCGCASSCCQGCGGRGTAGSSTSPPWAAS